MKIFKEDEETTKIVEMRYLSKSYAKIFLLVPLLALCTAFFFLLFLHWYPNLRKKFLYSEVNDIRKATHLFIIGTRNIIR